MHHFFEVYPSLYACTVYYTSTDTTKYTSWQATTSIYIAVHLLQWAVQEYYRLVKLCCMYALASTFVLKDSAIQMYAIYHRIPPICPLFLYASIRQNGRGTYARDHDISVWQPLPTDNPHMGERSMPAQSQAVWWIKQEKIDKVSLDMYMTQVVGVLTTSMVFTGLSIQIVVRVGGELMRETKIPVQELWL